jgi:hypothetical protein
MTRSRGVFYWFYLIFFSLLSILFFVIGVWQATDVFLKSAEFSLKQFCWPIFNVSIAFFFVNKTVDCWDRLRSSKKNAPHLD